MKKISIVLSLMLLAFAVSCSSPNKPGDNTETKGIALSERAGIYNGTMNDTMALEIVLNNNAQVTSIKVNNSESVDENNPITISEGASYTGTIIAPFDASVKMAGISMTAKVKIEFKSATDASLGATAYVQVPGGSDFDQSKASKVDLTYKTSN